MKSCKNCGKFPFCNNIQNPINQYSCENWIKRNITKLDEIDNGFYKFSNLGDDNE